jgi:hypothetical protein
MFFDDLFRSPEPLHNPIGFGPVDFVELAIAVMLAGLTFFCRGQLGPAVRRLSVKPLWGMIFFGLLPIALRLLLLRHHPVPSPDIYDEFGHLLVADTLRHWRLANPPHALHQFFETFFVLQSPTYSSIYPIGNGLALAVGWTLFGLPWAGVLLSVAALCALCYWMLRGWTTPGWALVGGMFAVMEFGPLNQWTNSYWGGALPAAAGCLVFGAVARLRERARLRDGLLLGAGVAIHLLVRPYESIFLVLSVLLFLVPIRRIRSLAVAGLIVLPALGITLLHNRRVTGEWTRLPYALSQYQYGVPAALTFQRNAVPHVPLTPQQELDYRMQREFHPGLDSARSYAARLLFRARYYRFYFYAPLYLALIAFVAGIRNYRSAWVAITCLVFAAGTNFFPAFQFHYMAAVVCLFILMSVEGLRRIASLPNGREAAALIVFLCVAQFVFFYGLDLAGAAGHGGPERRIEINRQISQWPGRLLVFVRYWPSHIFQDEWVYNGADIDGQRVVWARDLGADEDQILIRYYGNRKPLLLEPDARPPQLSAYAPETKPVPEETPPAPAKPPLLQLEQVR